MAYRGYEVGDDEETAGKKDGVDAILADKRYEPGDNVEITRNQGKREAVVLAVIGDKVLIEYTMPKGTTALNITTHEGS